MKVDARMYPAIVSGGGLVGCVCALTLARQGVGVRLVDPAFWDKGGFSDCRALTVNYDSEQLLTDLGVLPLSDEVMTPIRAIDIQDGEATHDDEGLWLSAPALGWERFGSIMRNDALLKVLREAVQAHPLIDVCDGANVVQCGQDSSRVWVQVSPVAGDNGSASAGEHEAQLLVGADGRNSTIRQQVGIPVRQHNYGVHALIAIIAHSHDHNNVAFERFLDSGPFAVLPLPGKQSGVVWVDSSLLLSEWLDCKDNTILAAEMMRRMGAYGVRLGDIAVANDVPVRCYPLHQRLAQTMARGRVVLVGDAGHVIHPVAGLGFNLGLRDCRHLGNVVGQAAGLGLDIGHSGTLKKWARRRSYDVGIMATLTHEANRLFAMQNPVWRWGRNRGMRVMSQWPLLQKPVVLGAMFGPFPLRWQQAISASAP